MATKPVYFRKVHGGLAALVQSHLQKKPFDGVVYVFRAKRADRLKMTWGDGTGLVMAYKRPEQNVFKCPAMADSKVLARVMQVRRTSKRAYDVRSLEFNCLTSALMGPNSDIW